jgi:uncharacterized sulfatase
MIPRRTFLRMSAGASAALLVSPALRAAKRKTASKQPNLLFVFADQFRPQALGFTGQDPTITPNLNAFAKQGLYLSRAISNSPVCSPYRGMLMSGKYPAKNGVWGNCYNGSPNMELDKNEFTISDALSKADYWCGYIGKWHLEHPRPPYVPSGNNRGKSNWEEWTSPDRRHSFDFWYAYNTWDNHFKPHYWTNNSTRDKRVEVKNQWSPEHETDMAIKLLKTKRDKTKPFAIFVSFNPPHTGYSCPTKYKKLYDGKTFEQLNTRKSILPGSYGDRTARRHLKNYFACVSGVDDQFGRMIKALKDEGLDKNTIVVFTSDHGNNVGCHNQVTKNNHYDESLIVPFLIRYPGQIKAGATDDLLLSVPDLYPTLLGLLGRSDVVPKDRDGVDFSKTLCGKTGPARPTSAFYAKGQFDINTGQRGVRTQRYTLMIAKNKKTRVIDKVILHDNKLDPYQLKNIACQKPDLVKTLIETELHPWQKKAADPWKIDFAKDIKPILDKPQTKAKSKA